MSYLDSHHQITESTQATSKDHIYYNQQEITICSRDLRLEKIKKFFFLNWNIIMSEKNRLCIIFKQVASDNQVSRMAQIHHRMVINCHILSLYPFASYSFSIMNCFKVFSSFSISTFLNPINSKNIQLLYDQRC